jgi:hypothetical protein
MTFWSETHPKKLKKVMSEQKIFFQSFIFNVRKGEKALIRKNKYEKEFY